MSEFFCFPALYFLFVLIFCTCSAVGGSLTNVSSTPSFQVTPAKGRMSGWTKDVKAMPQRGQQSKVNRKVKRVSQASNASSSDSPDSNRNSLDNTIELNEQACTVVFCSVVIAQWLRSVTEGTVLC